MFVIFISKSIIKQLLDLVYGFLHLKCIIKPLLDSVFVICKIINVSVRVITLAFGSADNSNLDIDNSAYHKNLIQQDACKGVHSACREEKGAQGGLSSKK